MNEQTQNGLGWLLIVALVVWLSGRQAQTTIREHGDVAMQEAVTLVQPTPAPNNDHFWRGQCDLTLLHPADFDRNPVLRRECQRLGIIR